MARTKLPEFVTPKGIAKYPWLNRPDTKFNPNGDYKVTMRFTEDELDAPIKHPNEDYNGMSLRELLDEAAAKATESAKAEAKPAKRKTLKTRAPYEEEVDDETGDPTGYFVATFKLRAKVEPKNGDAFTQAPKIFDAKRKPTKVAIYGGSVLRVIFQMVPYYMAKDNEAGVSLRLRGAQVIELGEATSQYSSMLDEEDGYEAEEESESMLDDEDSEDNESDEDDENF